MTNSTQPEETSSCLPRRWERLAWLPILLLTVLITGLWVIDLRTEYEWPRLQMTLNFVTRTLACLVVAFLAGRSYLERRQPGLLLMGCGVLIWGASGFITTAIVMLDANLGVTISNLGIWAAALCHLTGVSLSLQARRTIPATGLRLAACYALALGFVGMISLVTFAGWIPLFFMDGRGGTPIRYVVLGSAFLMFALTAAFLWGKNLRKKSSFNLWYSYALMLIAIGVFGMLIQTSRGSMLDWMTRCTQYLSGIYMLIAALSASRTSQPLDFSTTEEEWRENVFLAGLRQQTNLRSLIRYGFSVATVASAVGLQMTLEAWVGHGLPTYVTFYPAMMAVVVLIGSGPTVLATLLIALIACYWILPPIGEFTIASPVDRLGLAIFTGTNLFMCLFAELYRRSREKAAAYDREYALRESEARYRSIMDNLQDGFIRANKDGIVIMASPSVAQLYGLESGKEMIGMQVLSLYKNPEDRRMLLEELEKHGRVKDYECEALRKDGTGVPVSLNAQYYYDEKGEIQGTEAFVRDITERKQTETLRSMGQDILLVLNEDKNQKETIKRVINIIKSATGVDAVGIRLQDEDDFPYFYSEGFPEEFLLKENSLLARNRDGGICRDECGNICLECTCGLIVTGKTDPSSPLFTKGGSAWTNNSFPFLHVPADDDIRTNPRNECIHQGFASCALIPIRAKGRVVGLLQLNDHRKGCFTLEGIESLEKIAENIGEAMLRKQAEEALRENEERFRAVFDCSAVPMSLTSPNGSLTKVNAAYCQMMGYTEEELLALTFYDFTHPEEFDNNRAGVQQLLDGIIPFLRMEKRYIRKDGCIIWGDMSSAVVRDVTGRPLYMVTHVYDITDRKQAELSLIETRKALEMERDILQAVMNGAKNSNLVFLDRDFNFVCVNETYAQTCGYQPEQMIGKNHFDLYPNAENESIFAGVRDTGEPAEFHDKPFVFPDQPERGLTYWDWTLTPIKGSLGQVTGLVLSLFETTDRKQSEEKLKIALEGVQRYSGETDAILSSMLDAVLVYSNDMNVMRVNPGFYSVYGFDPIGMNVRDIIEKTHCRNHDGTQLIFDQQPTPRAVRGEKVLNQLFIITRLDGQERILETSSSPMLVGDQVAGTVTVWHDITERKRAENALIKLNEELEKRVEQRTAELREKDQMLLLQSRQAAMGEMIGNIAHQWRQPLNYLGMQLQQLPLFYDLGQFNKELLVKNVAGSMEIIKHMSKTIDDFRNYFMPDKDKTEFNVRESINKCLSILEGSLKNPLIDVEIVSNDDLIIYGYSNEFAQVILNIMNNARDVFIERNVSKPKIFIKICNEGRCVVVTVADNAGGIPEDIINKVFDPYFTTKGPQQGTGVGLFMSKSIIEKNMGGRLNVRNIADGAEFRIEVLNGSPT